MIGSLVGAHGAHFLVAIFALVVLGLSGGVPVRSGRRRRVPTPTAAPDPAPATEARAKVPVGLQAAVPASLAAGLVHVLVCPQHFREGVALGVFFVLAATAQVGWALWAARRATPPLVLAGAIVSIGLIVVWIVSRTVGVPVGENPWTPEAVGGQDVLATVLEAVVIFGCALTLRGWHHPDAIEAVGR